MLPDLFTCAQSEYTESVVRSFVANAIAERLQAESVLLEFKSRRHGLNVVESVAALSNTEGGIVFVGVAEADDPFVGIDASEVDSMAQQLRAMLPDAMPELIPVAVSEQPGKVIVALRVNSDLISQPIVVAGRVLVRSPGSNDPANRDEVVRLVSRGLQHSSTDPRLSNLDVGNISLWPPGTEIPVEVRAHASYVLPHRVRNRPFLGSDVVEGLADWLNGAPVPSQLGSEFVRDHERVHSGWELVETSRARLKFRSDLQPAIHRGRPWFQSALLVQLDGRSLDLVCSVAVGPDDGGLSLDHLREVLLGAAFVSAELGEVSAHVMEAAAPLPAPAVAAWIGGDEGLSCLRLERGWLRTGVAADLPRLRLESVQLDDRRTGSLLSAANEWMNLALLDLGAIGFESRLTELASPAWWSNRAT